jgi:hypothetical protein
LKVHVEEEVESWIGMARATTIMSLHNIIQEGMMESEYEEREFTIRTLDGSFNVRPLEGLSLAGLGDQVGALGELRNEDYSTDVSIPRSEDGVS